MNTPKYRFPVNAPKLKDLYSIAVQTRRLAANTQKAYWRWIREYIKFNKLTHPGTLSEQEISMFLRHLVCDRKVSPSTQNQALHALLFLYHDVLGKRLGKIQLVPRARVRRRAAPILSHSNFLRIIETVPSPYRLPLYLMYMCGLRSSEVVNLKIRDVVDQGQVLKIVNSKSLNDRLALVPSILRDELNSFLSSRRVLYDKIRKRSSSYEMIEREIVESIWQSEPLFPSCHAYYDPSLKCSRLKPLSRSHIAAILKKSAKLVGLGNQISPHSLRHAFATNAYRKGVNIRVLQTILGHKDPNTTCLYIEPFEALSAIESPLDTLGVIDSKPVAHETPPIFFPESRNLGSRLRAFGVNIVALISRVWQALRRK